MKALFKYIKTRGQQSKSQEVCAWCEVVDFIKDTVSKKAKKSATRYY